MTRRVCLLLAGLLGLLFVRTAAADNPRQVAADALLAELATHDFRQTEFGRPLEELAREYRAQHVADIRAFRETIAAEDWPAHPEWALHAGRWLGAYIEVTVVRATGEVDNVLVEID